MKILALDCSCPEHGTWAWAENGAVQRAETFPGKASIHLFTHLAAHRNLQSDILLVGVGPGSFNGIRVSISCAMGMAAAWGSPVEAMRSTDALAWKNREKNLLSIFTPGRKGEFFLTRYAEGKLTSSPTVHPLTTLENILPSCGYAISSHPIAGIENFTPPQAADLIHYYLANGPEHLSLQPIHPQQTA